jgi:hypothetical protein
MKPLTKLSRVFIFAACAIWFMARMPTVHAQLMNCSTYYTENDFQVCPDCCTDSIQGMNSRPRTDVGLCGRRGAFL